MTTIYTTSRCLTVKESYETIADFLQRDEQKMIELTEVVTIYGEMTGEIYTNEKKVLLNKKYIVEVLAS